jgi:hypothetical protein
MAYVVMVDTPGMTAELYDKSGEMMGMKGRLPEGCLVHIAGPGPKGWRVVSIWDSLEKARHFATTIVGPVQVQLGVAPTKPPVIWELYSLDVEPQPAAAGNI